ncbi:MAG: nucleotidyltransferase domain-containing protein [Candidatus Kariarchaeaceae archaeon]
MLTEDSIQAITQKFIDAAIQLSKNQIKIICMYGSRAKGTFHPQSDLEFFVILDDEYPGKINFEFFYENIPIDLWSIPWSKVEATRTGKEYWCLPAGTFATAKIVYSRSKKDLEDFMQLRADLFDTTAYHANLLEQNKEVFKRLEQGLGRLVLAKSRDDKFEARAASWGLIISVTNMLSHINGKYYTDNWGLNLKQAFQFEHIPANLQEDLLKLATSLDYDSLIETTIGLTEKMRLLLQQANVDRVDREVTPDILNDSHYYGIIAYINKILKATDEQNIFSLSYAAWELQESLAHDSIMLQEKKWSKAYDYYTYKDFKSYFEQLSFPSFLETVSEEEYELVKEQARLLLAEINEIVKENRVVYRYFTSEKEIDNYLQNKSRP